MVEILATFGRTDVTLINKTLTLGPMGEVATAVETSSTVTGDLQFATKADVEFFGHGVLNAGDGIFYTFHDTSITPDDEISVDSVRYRLTSQLEGGTINTSVVYQAWRAIKRV